MVAAERVIMAAAAAAVPAAKVVFLGCVVMACIMPEMVVAAF